MNNITYIHKKWKIYLPQYVHPHFHFPAGWLLINLECSNFLSLVGRLLHPFRPRQLSCPREVLKALNLLQHFLFSLSPSLFSSIFSWFRFYNLSMTEKEIIGTFFNKVLHNKKTNIMTKPCLTNKLCCNKKYIYFLFIMEQKETFLQIWERGNCYYYFIYTKL